MIRFAYFDAGGTMLSPHPSVGAVYARAGRDFGVLASAEELERAFRSAWKKHGRGAASRMGGDESSARAWWRALVFDVFDTIGFVGPNRDACFDAFFLAFAQRDAWRLHDDVLPALEALRARGIACGVLSNWDYRLRALLEMFDLARFFEHVVISSEVGSAKPDPAIFELAAFRAGVAPGSILYAGDDVSLDVEPARRAGMHGYLIDRTGAHSGTPFAISSLTDLAGLANP